MNAGSPAPAGSPSRNENQPDGPRDLWSLLRYLQATDPATAAAVNRAITAAWSEDALEPSWPNPIPLGPAEPDPLPIRVLPPSLRHHVESVAGATQTPADLGVLLGLGAASAALAGKVEIVADERRGWREVAGIYVAAILPPGSRKSPVYDAFEAPIREWEEEAQRSAGPARRSALDRLEVLEGQLRSAVQAATKAGNADAMAEVEDARHRVEEAEQRVPALPRLLASDATPEALVRLMAEQRGRAALMAPEGDPFRILDGRYSRGGEARLDELKRAWSGEAIRVDRVGRDPVHVPRPALTLAVCMQPGVLGTLANARSFRGEGVLARVLWAMPNPALGRRLTGRAVPALDQEAGERYAKVLRELLELQPGGQGADGRPDPHVLEVSGDSGDVLYAFEAEIEAEIAPGGRLAGIADWAAKACGQAVRLAGLLEVWARAEDGRPLWGDPISRSAMEGGVELMRALESHALAVLDHAGTDEELALRRYVWTRVRELGDRVTVRDLYQATKGKSEIAEVKDLEKVLRALEDRHLLRLQDRPNEGPGRPPSPWIRLHPALRDDPYIDIPIIPRTDRTGVPSGDCEDCGDMDRAVERLDIATGGDA